MAYVELVIKIPEDSYKATYNERMLPPDVRNVVNAIKNGTPLPKGHGRLIDANAFITKMEDASKRQKYKELLIDKFLTVGDVFKAIIESLQNETLTIIEADKENNNIFEKMTEEEQTFAWMFMILNKDKIIEKTEQWTKKTEEIGMTLTEYLESISPLNNKKPSWLGKNCKDCCDEKCKELGTLHKGYDCALWKGESEDKE